MSRTPFARLIAAGLALGLVAAACASEEGATDVAAAPSPSTTEADTTLQISAPAADGSTINLADYAGQDLMLWFWAPW